MLAKLRDICLGFRSLIVGLGVSRKTGLESAVTEQYPDAVFNRPFKRHGVSPRQVADRYRGILALRWDWEYEIPTCIACRNCERVCPSKCISGIEGEGRGKLRRATAFKIDLFQCCLCGLCVEACPVEGKAIIHTRDFETVSRSYEALVVDFEWLHEHGKQYHPRPEGVVVKPWPPAEADVGKRNDSRGERGAER